MRTPFAFSTLIQRAAIIATLALTPALASAAGNVAISQVYGGGGNTGATFKNDFIELINRGTTPVTLTGWSVQYASAANATWQKTTLTGTLQPGQYFLIQQAVGAGGTVNLPTPEIVGTIPMSGTAGKIALVNNDTALTCGNATAGSCIGNAALVDFVGFGATASNFEGSGATPAPSNSTSVLRAGNGCTDTDNNAGDFAAGAPAPRNSASPLNTCGAVSNAPVVASCPATLSATVGSAVSAVISATDADGVVIDADITSAAIAGISLSGITPATTVNGALQATLNVNAAAGTYSVQVLFVNNSLPEQGATCTIAVTVAPAVVVATRIRDIQGAAHTSPLVGQTVSNVEGIVTGKRSNGFYMQDSLPDANPATSEGIFVFTSTAPTVAVGDAVRVAGTVAEFRAGGAASANLSITQIGSPTIVVVSAGNALPAAQVIGIGGRIPPNVVIDDDATGSVESSGTFDATTDGIDFWESLEGMRVRFVDAIAVGPTSNFGEIPIVADNGANAGLRSVRGGIMATQTDGNPEKILLDDAMIFPTILANANVGDRIAEVSGIVDYSFGTFKVLVTAQVAVISNGLAAEITTAQNTNQLAIGAYNVENLDPSDGAVKFNTIAGQIVSNMKAPDIIGLTEIQDNNGATNDAIVDSSLTLQTLINAISAAGGPTYSYRVINPVDDQDGGEPGGNIRVGFLFNPARVSFIDRAGGTATTAISAVNAGGLAQLSVSPGRIDPTNVAFNSSRKPLAGEFMFNGRKVIAIVNHFNSKGGDQPLMGRFQPPVRSSEVQRIQQATIVANFIQSLTAIEPTVNVVVLGDLNDFEYSPSLTIVKNAGMTDLIETLPANERYSYVFEGNSQALDHILVSQNLMATAAPIYDIVHINSEFANQASDHDPEVVRLTLLPPAIDVTGDVQVSRLGLVLNRLTNRFTGTISIKNTGTTAIAGPIQVQLANLSAGVTLTNASGVEAGAPYITGVGPIAPGATLVLPLSFANPARVPLNYDVRVYSGQFSPAIPIPS